MSNFFKLIGAEKHSSEKNKKNISGDKNEVRLSIRKSGERKALAINLPREFVENILKWKRGDNKIRIDLYIKKNEGIGLIINDDGKYSLSSIKRKEGSISCYETRFNIDNELIADNLDFVNNPIKTSIHNDDGINILWIEINK